jgi:hypothetical protein
VAQRAGLKSVERTPGKETLNISLSAFDRDVAKDEAGDPVSGATAYAVCIYDLDGGLVAEMSVPPGGTCGLWPRWDAIEKVERMGLKYDDRSLRRDGVQRLRVRTGPAGNGRAALKGANKLVQGWMNLPVGISAALADAGGAIVQMSARDAMCVSARLGVVKSTPGLFTARTASRRR